MSLAEQMKRERAEAVVSGLVIPGTWAREDVFVRTASPYIRLTPNLLPQSKSVKSDRLGMFRIFVNFAPESTRIILGQLGAVLYVSQDHCHPPMYFEYVAQCDAFHPVSPDSEIPFYRGEIDSDGRVHWWTYSAWRGGPL